MKQMMEMFRAWAQLVIFLAMLGAAAAAGVGAFVTVYDFFMS